MPTNVNNILYGQLILRVIDVSFELGRQDRGEIEDVPNYQQLGMDANTEGLEFRQLLAEAIFLHGSEALRGSRAMDNCFENLNGSRVVAFLIARAQENPKLHTAIARSFGGSFPDKWNETAARVERLDPLIKNHGITGFAPANSRFRAEERNEGRYVGLTDGGFTAFTFSWEEISGLGLAIEPDKKAAA